MKTKWPWVSGIRTRSVHTALIKELKAPLAPSRKASLD